MCDGCGCETASTTPADAVGYRVDGMTCGHCAQAVTAEVSKLGGVEDVSVDVAAGVVSIRSTQTVDESALRTAVDEAGYELVGPAS